jgi:hypothetical protein
MSVPTHLTAVDFGQGISNAWSSVATFVPRLLAFLAVLLVGWFVAKLVAKAVDVLLARVGFDRVAARSGVQRMLASSRYTASTIVSKLLYYAVLLLTLQAAFAVWGPNPVSDILTAIVAWLPRAVVAIVIIVVAGAIARAVRDFVTNTLAGLSYGPLLGTVASVFIWGLGIIAALNQVGVATTVTTPVLITVLATAGGIAVVGLGGGLVRPMQARWERWIGRLEDELPTAKHQVRAQADAYRRAREDMARATAPPSDTASHTAQTTRMPAPPAGPPTAGHPAPPGTIPGNAAGETNHFPPG